MPKQSPLFRRYAPGLPLAPLRVFVLVLAAAFAVESAIMLELLPWLSLDERPWLVAMLDAGALTLVLAPAVWVLVARPLESLCAERGDLLARVFDAQEQERARIARDLHDELGQQLTGLLLSARALEDSTTADTARAHSATIRRMAADALEAVRRLARGLAPVVLHDLGLRAAIQRLCEDVGGATDFEIAVHCDLPRRRVAPSVETAVYRVVQEAVTNAVRHSHARRLDVRLTRRENDLIVLVADDGRGFEPRSLEDAEPGLAGGLGLRGMRERIELLRGAFRIDSCPESGTTLSMRIPDVYAEATTAGHAANEAMRDDR